MNKIGDVGVGTLIIFIAFVVISTIAAGIVLQTTNLLQSKALTTGKETTKEIGTNYESVSAYATNGSDDRYVEYFFWTVRPSGGSEDVKYTDLLITMNTNNQSQEYTFSTSVNCSNSSSINASSTNFGINIVLPEDGGISGYFVQGDVTEFCFKSVRPMAESEKIKLNMVPKRGSTLTETILLPSLMIQDQVYIYP